MRHHLAATYGWTFAQIDDMTWEQINSAMREGKPYKGIPAENLQHALEIQKDMKANWREYYGV